jgi:hypothetical protein
MGNKASEEYGSFTISFGKNTEFLPGDNIFGQVKVEHRKEFKAKSLTVSLVG